MCRPTARRTARLIAASAGCILLAGATAGCTGDDGSTGAATTTSAVSTANPPLIPTPGTGVFGQASAAACTTDRNVVETAVESYLAMNGGSEVTESQLVQQGLLKEPSRLHDIGPGGAVVPAPQGGCTG